MDHLVLPTHTPNPGGRDLFGWVGVETTSSLARLTFPFLHSIITIWHHHQHQRHSVRA
jgi:hypothetical protein